MIQTGSCPFTALAERDLVGPELSSQELAKLSEHLDSGCGVCEEHIEQQLSGAAKDLPGADDRRELEALLSGALLRAEPQLNAGQAAVLDRVKARIRREDAFQARQLRRRHLRAIFYVTNVAAVLLMLVAYVGLAAAVRLKERSAHVLATQTEVRALVTALSRYVRDHPGAELPDDMPGLIAALQSERPGGGPYFRFDPSRLRGGDYLDDFGRAYRYQRGTSRAQISSVGADGVDAGGGDDDLSLSVLFGAQ